jgi:hypothetical protein
LQPEITDQNQVKEEIKLREEYKPITKKKNDVPIEISLKEHIETTEKLKKQKDQSQHRYLQSLVKRMAESKGYKATIEEPTPDGKGRVDVSLERNGKRIACEISVTTEVEWEVHNLEKCLNAGYDLTVACSNEKRTIENIRRKIESSFDDSMRSKVLICEPEQFFLYLDQEVAKDSTTETRMKGYRVKVEYDPLSENERKNKEASITRVVLSSRKKKQE